MFGSVEAFEAEYGQSVSEWKAEFQDPVMEQLLAGRMQAQINQQVRATPAEVQQLFAETPADSLPLIPEAVRYRELVLQPAITEAQKADVRNFLDSIRTRVSTGALSMTLAASRHSKTPAASTKAVATRTSTAGNSSPNLKRRCSIRPSAISLLFLRRISATTSSASRTAAARCSAPATC